MQQRKYSQFKFGAALAIGVVVASVLCVQCVRTYLYTDAVLVPQQAEREAERQVGALTSAARTAGITDARALGRVIEHVMESAGDRVLWIRVLDPESELLAQSGNAQGTAKVPSRWWERVEAHDNLGVVVDTPSGKALVAMLPFRLPRPPHGVPTERERPEAQGHPPGGHGGAYVIEVAIPLKAVAGAFDGLRQNLIVGVIASMALLLSLAVIGLRAPHYLRGRYLESELQLARRVQSDLQPKPELTSRNVEFGASSIAADHIGGDFYDVFEAESGKVSIVLGDVSGKGVPAALLVSVLQGAIRSSTASKHERACEQINRMLCERTACERFATLFWGVFDPTTSTLRYVNAGHAAPMLVRNGQDHSKDEGAHLGEKKQIIRLQEGGPVLGLLPIAAYSAGSVRIEASDMLVLYSDGINEASNRNGEEFGEERIKDLISEPADVRATEVCKRISNEASGFARPGAPADDQTLVVVKFPQAGSVMPQGKAEAGVATAA